MNIKETKTENGLKLFEFNDLYETKCSIQASSLANKEAIWLGVEDANPQILASKTKIGGNGWVSYPIPDGVEIKTRMHLTREQVQDLMPILQKFVDTGEL